MNWIFIGNLIWPLFENDAILSHCRETTIFLRLSDQNNNVVFHGHKSKVLKNFKIERQKTVWGKWCFLLERVHNWIRIPKSNRLTIIFKKIFFIFVSCALVCKGDNRFGYLFSKYFFQLKKLLKKVCLHF